MASKHYRTQAGDWGLAGATFAEGGVNFCCFSRHATKVELLLFEQDHSREPFQIIELDPKVNHTFFFWHVLVEDLPDGIYYGWRIDGPNDTRESGCRHDPDKLLLDPWCTTVSDRLWDRHAASRPGCNLETAMRAKLVRDEYDWEGDQHLHVPLTEAIIYELHVGGFTRHPSADTQNPGTFRAIIEKIPYLSELGITHVELLPVMAFDLQDVPPNTAQLGLENYWGYSTHSFFAPHPHYACDPSHARDEFRDMVKALHRAGIGVILDVVYNHTAEGGADGPIISFKGMGNEIFYHLDFDDRRRYRDYTGCGNTVNCNHPLVTRFLIDSLYYWAHDMHVDGFRFDLASAMARGEDGNPQYHAPVLWSVELSPELGRAHIIAEAWDAAGLYQVGDFPGFRWAEWNGLYRDTLRAFVRGDPGLIGDVATRIAGSSDLYQSRGRRPGNSINLITCHDGFSLHDLVSYDEKHNEANGEDNRDGHDHNLSWNCGVEGPTDDPAILALRRQQARNFMALLLLSQGVPMLLAGDELLRTKQGNNNAYCQNNELSWVDWRLADDNREMLDFTRGMIAFRQRHSTLRRNHFLTGEPQHEGGIPDIRWHGIKLDKPLWGDPGARVLAFTLAGLEPDEPHLHVMLNMWKDRMAFALPPVPGRRWHRAIDTASEPFIWSPHDQALVTGDTQQVAARSILVLEAR
ncbi:glycogen debranching protein GlgX [Halochromatium glycolicum]|uniref:Glycogen debranching enzyme GlgX n=1 Tax=Halochromatium glycolicum TaxID=85075 RepID=A0AAJ0U352_9GAMM|nr:glycogen debranching protein GlgX [Halochromatium glycolicum]MBK1704424.1 glycogen debranching enzyme GlgX [Halochromatium glycolicum]